MADREELEALRRLAELEARTKRVQGLDYSEMDPQTRANFDASQGAGTPPQAGAGASTSPGLQTQPEASAPAAPYQTGALANTLRQMGEESSGLGKLGLGVMQSGARTARAVGLPQALRAMGMNLDPEGDTALDQVAKGTGALGTTGDVLGTLAQVIPATAAAGAAVPAALTRAAIANYPRLAAYLGAAGGAAASTAAMTPGDLGERGTEAAKAAALALPLTAAARVIAKPAQMSEVGRNLRAATGEVPPLHIGAESPLIRDVGEVMTGIPGLGAPLVAGEKRVFNAGVKQLWEHATPPGQTNLLSQGGSVERGTLFEQLKSQFDNTYDTLLKGHRIPTTNADRQKITRIIDNELVPEDAARLHKIMDKYFPSGNFMGGRTWKELQEIVRSNESKFAGSDSAIEKKIGSVLGDIDDYLITMRNRGVPKDVAKNLDATDQAYAVRKLLEKAVGGAKGYEGLDPAKLAAALSARTSEAALARGHGTGQTLVDSMAAALGNMDHKNTGQALWGLRRLIAPSLAAGYAGGLPGLAAPASTVGAMNFLGAGARGAKAMFGEYGFQKKLAEIMQNRPELLPGLSSGLEVQSQE